MIHVVIADDSAFLRQILVDVLQKSRKVKVVFAAKNGKEAIEAIKQLKPDLAIFDVEMPVMNGLEALRRVMAESPLPVLMFSSLTQEGAAVTLKALEYGAIDFLLKPSSLTHGLDVVSEDLIRKIEAIASKNRLKKLSTRSAVASGAGKENSAVAQIPQRNIELIVMGSSTGGVQASMAVLQKLPVNLAPILWVQHMPASFTERFAARLSDVCQVKVKEAQNGEIIKKGFCYLGPGGFQMQVERKMSDYVLNIGGTEKRNGFCPSCDVLFESVGKISALSGKNVLGIILTGMGNDGTAGLVQLHQNGAYVIGQDEESCAVYGMPRAAFEAGAVDVQLDVNDIASGIVQSCGFKK